MGTVRDGQIYKESLPCKGERSGCNNKKKIPEKSKENLKKQSKPLNHVPREILEDNCIYKMVNRILEIKNNLKKRVTRNFTNLLHTLNQDTLNVKNKKTRR